MCKSQKVELYSDYYSLLNSFMKKLKKIMMKAWEMEAILLKINYFKKEKIRVHIKKISIKNKIMMEQWKELQS